MCSMCGESDDSGSCSCEDCQILASIDREISRLKEELKEQREANRPQLVRTGPAQPRNPFSQEGLLIRNLEL